MSIGRKFGVDAILVSMLLAGSLLACKQAKRTQGSAPVATSASAQPSVASEEERDNQLSEKLNGYIECLNGISSQVARARHHYLLNVDEKKGPSDRGSYINLYISAEQPCFAALAKVKSLPPRLPAVEAAATSYEQSLREVLLLIKQAAEYYKQGNYKDDKYAKGKAMHGPLLAAFTKFGAANDALDAGVTQLNEQLAERRLKALAKDPTQKLRYLVVRSQAEAKALVRAADVKAMKQLDPEKFAALVATYEKTVGEMDAYTSGHKAEVEKVNGYSNFESATKSLLKSAKDLMRRKRDNQDFAKESGSPTSIEGHPAQVLEQYNQLVTNGNSLYFH